MMPRRHWLTAAAGLLLSRTVSMAADDPLQVYRWKRRVLLVLAPDKAAPDVSAQRRMFAAMGPAASERDMTLLEITDATPDSALLRRRFGLGPGFHAVLIGKDGGAKLGRPRPLRPDELLPLIDAMPMRQDEMRRQSAR